MKLLQLDIQTLPGIHPGFSVGEFDPGINLVIAPNAVGKSSLLRALNYLISGVRPGDPAALALTATFQDSDTRWTVRRTGSSIVWERNGQPSESPPLPAADQLHCYWFSMEDLLAADVRDDSLLRELRQTLSGGFDLDAVLESVGPRHGVAQAKALTDATRERRKIEANYENLKHQESQLPELREKLQKAEAAAVEARALAQALSLLDAREGRIQAETGLRKFPENMSRLRGDELERLQKLESKREEISNEFSARQSALLEARERLRATGFDAEIPEEAEFDLHTSTVLEIRNKADQKRTAIERLSAAEREEQHALWQLGGTTTPPKLDPGSISIAETFAVKIQQLMLKRDETKARMPAAAAAPDPREQTKLSSAAESLRGWLDAEQSVPKAAFLILGIAACLIMISTVAGFLAEAWIAGCLAALALGVIAWLAWTLSRDASASFRTRYEETGLIPPGAWTSKSVREKLNEIEIQISALREAELRARQANEMNDRLAVIEPQLAEAELEKTALAEKLGFDPGITAAGLDRLVRLITGYENAAREREDTRATIALLEEEIAASQNEVREFLTKWQVAIPEDAQAASLAAALDGLRTRARAATTAHCDIAAATREIARAEAQLTELDADCTALLNDAEITNGDTAQLARCCEQFDAWKRQNELLHNAHVREVERRIPLEDNPEILRRVEAGERTGMEKELPATQALADQATELRDQITQIETRAKDAGHDAILEHASAEEQAALESLEDALDKALYSDAENFLIDGVRNEYRTGHEPELLQNAREQFLRFTHHAFRLEVDPQNGFMAFDTQRQAMRQLSELSSGTRMQLLLAMRLAWTRKIEQRSLTLPLFLDEALTTSDEERFKQVVASLEELATEEDRQIIYLSARQHEVALWEHASGRQPHVIDLAAIRFGNASATPGDYSLPHINRLPAPGSKSPEAYAAELGIQPVNPRIEPGAISIFHILRDDLPLLHNLLENWRIRTVGQLQSLLKSEAARHAVSNADIRERLSGRCAVTTAWIGAWREGRGKAIDRIALESSEVVSDAFIEAVSDLAASHSGDAGALIGALRSNAVKRFRADKIDQLETWLEQQGYIDPLARLDSEGRARRILERTSGQAPPDDIRKVIHWLEAGSK